MQLSRQPSSPSRAFSLVEMSIVIAIIGLLVGGIMGGRNLIQAAQLRSVMTDANHYLSAAKQFRTQYNYLPGDMLTATSYWSGVVTGNGDGDGTITGDERYRFWQVLNLAGYVEDAYTGADAGTPDFKLGTNVPASRINNAGFSFYYENFVGSDETYNLNIGNLLSFGEEQTAGPPISAALIPNDAFNIDSKMDDGNPGSGNWIANSLGTSNDYQFGQPLTCTLSADKDDYDKGYNRQNNVVACSFFIRAGI
jgi:prepilin-type N-terminal cleavage/methylation domain-containing protein